MDMKSWAEKEIEIACAREKANAEDSDEWNYGVACYQSALKAFNSLCEDGHSGMSIGITKAILNRLIEGKPLTPIEDTPDIWNERFGFHEDNEVKTYQCTRMSSLFKDVYPDGTVKYSDVGRVICSNTDSPDIPYRSSLARKLMDEMFPISMPYSGATIHVVLEDFLTDPKNGDFDTVGILYIKNEDGSTRDITRYFKEGKEDWIEIDAEEYFDRKFMANAFKATVEE